MQTGNLRSRSARIRACKSGGFPASSLEKGNFTLGDLQVQCGLLLWIAIVVTLRGFFEVSRLAGWLLVPYLAWVSFAAFLNSPSGD